MIKKDFMSYVWNFLERRFHTFMDSISQMGRGKWLFIQPDVVQLLVQIMAWSNLPAFDIRPVRIDLVPPQGDGDMSHITQSTFFILTDQTALFRRTGSPSNLFVEIFKHLVIVLSIVVSCTSKELGDVSNRIDDRLTIKINGNIEILLLP